VARRSAGSVISRADRDAGPRRPCPRESGRGRERCPERGAAGQGPRRLTRRGARRATRDRGGTTPAAPHRRVRGPPSAERAVYDQRRRTAAAQGRANEGSGRGARTGDQRSITSVKRAGRALRLPPAPSDDDRDPL